MLLLLLTLLVTTCGICSFSTAHTYDTVNQYGKTIKMWGAGIYAHDSYFKAPIFIGSDFTILIFVIPMATLTFIKAKKTQSVEQFIRSFEVFCLLLYYSASLALGVTYNYLHLAYIALFSLCFFGVWLMLIELHTLEVRQGKVCLYPFTKGMKIFLLMAGISLFVAWLPDIIASIINKTSLDLIEVYTTEITYVLDMGIISPLMFITYHQIKHGKFIGYVLIRMIFKVCMIIGIMLPIQSVFQMLAGVLIPLPALITKVLIFVLLAAFAAFFEYRLKRETKYAEGIIMSA
jgi:hypothetical protein